MSDYVPLAYCRRVVGVDPGYVNFAICQIEFRGLRYSDDYTEEIPVFSILHWQIWDLRAGMSMCNSQATGGRYTRCSTRARPLPGDTLEANVKASTLDDWLAQMNHFITRSAWLFERAGDDQTLPDVTVENQFDQIKSRGNKFDMLLISRQFSGSVDALDKRNAETVPPGQQRPMHARKFAKSTLKHGIKNNGELTYGGRKGTGVEITYALLRQLGLVEWIAFLTSVASAGQKIDDLCDAFLLALIYATREYEEYLKQQRRKKPATGATVPGAAPTPTQAKFALRQTPCGSMDKDIMQQQQQQQDTSGVRLLSERKLNTNDDDAVEETFFPEHCGADDDTSEEEEDDYALDSSEEERVQAFKKQRKKRAPKQKQQKIGTHQLILKRKPPPPPKNQVASSNNNLKTKRTDDREGEGERPTKKTKCDTPITILIDDTIESDEL